MSKTPSFLRAQDIDTYERWLDELGQDTELDQARMHTIFGRLKEAAAQRDAAYDRVSQALRQGTITYPDGRTKPIRPGIQPVEIDYSRQLN